MPADHPEVEPVVKAVLRVRLNRELDGRLIELDTCSREERAQRVRLALMLQVSLMAFEKRGTALVSQPSAAGFVSEDQVFIASC